jgi:CspA family cold shock protein
MRGVVQWFDAALGYGFVKPQGGGPDVFVHITAVESAGLDKLVEGQQVAFEIGHDRGKAKVENLKLLSAARKPTMVV